MSTTVTNRLTECRNAKGIKKSQLAFYLKKSRGYVTRLEQGDIQPSIESALRIAQYFGKPVEHIFQLATISRSVSAPSADQQLRRETTNER